MCVCVCARHSSIRRWQNVYKVSSSHRRYWSESAGYQRIPRMASFVRPNWMRIKRIWRSCILNCIIYICIYCRGDTTNNPSRYYWRPTFEAVGTRAHTAEHNAQMHNEKGHASQHLVRRNFASPHIECYTLQTNIWWNEPHSRRRWNTCNDDEKHKMQHVVIIIYACAASVAREKGCALLEASSEMLYIMQIYPQNLGIYFDAEIIVCHTYIIATLKWAIWYALSDVQRNGYLHGLRIWRCVEFAITNMCQHQRMVHFMGAPKV